MKRVNDIGISQLKTFAKNHLRGGIGISNNSTWTVQSVDEIESNGYEYDSYFINFGSAQTLSGRPEQFTVPQCGLTEIKEERAVK